MNGEAGPGAGLDTLHLHPTLARQPHPVRHSGGCGRRVPSPHPDCQAWANPYLAGELRRTTLSSTGATRITVVWIDCHGCGVTVQHSEATA